jgi:AsmA protein
MRKLVVAIVVIVVLVAGMVLALPHLVDVDRYRGQVQAELQKRLNRPVQLGQLSLSVFPLKVKASNVIIGDDPSYHSNVPFAQVAELDLSVKLFPLLTGKVEVTSLQMKRPQIELICNAQGVWNFSTAGNFPAAAAASQAAPSQPRPPATAAQPREFALGELKISDGQIAISNDQKRQSRAIYDHIDVTLKNYAPGQPFALDLTAHLPGSGPQTLRVTGNGGPIDNANIASTAFKGTLKLDEVSLVAAQNLRWKDRMRPSRDP